MVMALCLVDEDKVEEPSSGEFKGGGVVLCAKLEDRPCCVVETGEKIDLCSNADFPFKAGSTA